MTNWRTSLIGLITALLAFVAFDPQWFHPVLVSVAKFFMVGGLAGIGLAAKDSNKK